MRYYDNGSGFTVGYTSRDADNFSRRWPCSTVEGSGSFSFDARGNLVGVSGTARECDGWDWVAFSQDCQAYGRSRRAPKGTVQS